MDAAYKQINRNYPTLDNGKEQRRGSMYLEEETSTKAGVLSCFFSLKEEVGALAKALRLFESPSLENGIQMEMEREGEWDCVPPGPTSLLGLWQ
ncbi:unnamed protein product [Coregonus sp. 'balchen']|nr:unnamed protein product [Coregonus sp. 'balchen']